MDRKSTLLLGFAIVAIGLFIIPSTMSMFVGQHRWYSVRTIGDQYAMCQRCHTAEVGEWQANTGAHAAYAADNPTIGCFCHQINGTSLTEWGFNASRIDSHGFEIFNETGLLNISDGSWSWTNNTSWRTTDTPHAAITIECVSCHYNASEQLNNTNSAHRQFFVQAKNASLNPYGTNNTACMACHTMVGLNINITRVQSGINVTATHNPDYTWTVNVTTNTTETTSGGTYYPANGT
jgi:hypothetical protein